jgi:hypothetical protein
VLEQLQPTRFGKLRHLYLDGNPFCLRPHYRESRAFPSWTRFIWTEIYLCHACSCHESVSIVDAVHLD